MKFGIEKKELIAIKHIPFGKFNIVPIISNFLITAHQDGIRVVGTDLENTTYVDIKTAIEEEGTCCVDSKTLSGIIQSFKDGVILFETVGDKLWIKQGKSTFSLLMADHSQFPVVPEVNFENSVVLNIPDLKDIGRICGNTTLKEMSTPVLTGIHLIITKHGFTAVSSDRKRITEIKYNIAFLEDRSVTVPVTPFNVICGLDGEGNADVVFQKDYIAMRYENITIINRTILGAFPNVESFMSKEMLNQVVINKKEFLNALKQVELVIDREYNRVKLAINGDKLEVDTVNSELGSGSIDINCKNINNVDLVMAFNISYLISLLGLIDASEVKMFFDNPEADKHVNTPVFFHNEPDIKEKSIKWLVMPMRFK